MAKNKNKLSPAQEKILEEAKATILKARSYPTFEEYFLATNNCNVNYNTPEKYKSKDPKGWEKMERWWKNKLKGIVLCSASGPTIKKLEKLGYIKIMEDTTNTGSYKYDTIQVLNF